MNKIKDLLYNINDILLALLIIAVAAFLIYWRMEVIVDYPQTLAQETETVKTTTQAPVESKDESKMWIDDKLTKKVEININSGSATDAVKQLVAAQLFDSVDQFIQLSKSLGKDYTRIQAGRFTFEVGKTRNDIINTVVK